MLISLKPPWATAASLAVFTLLLGTTNSAIVKYYCGSSLSDALQSACRHDGFPLHFPVDRNVNFRAKRGIVEECCHNPCSKFQLRQYCNGKFKKPSSSSKRKRSDHSLNAIKRKNSEDSHTTWQCEIQPSLLKIGGPLEKSHRRRRNKKRNRKTSQKLTATTTSTTEVPWSPEVQYVNDWADSGEAPLYLGSNH